MNEEKELPFLEHLAELRDCLSKTLIGIFICAAFSFAYAENIFHFLCAPLLEFFGTAELIGTGPAEAFLVKLKTAVVAGLLFAAPLSFFQLWKFISPALHENERRNSIPFVILSTAFFLSGVSFCFFLVLPYAFQFFYGEFTSIGVAPRLRIGEYLSFLIRMVLVFGLVFEMPVLSYFLSRMGILTHHWLIKHARISIVGVFIVAAILTPPDIATQFLLAVPLILIYGLCISIAYVVSNKRAEQKANSESE
jgi:sec-independent protein translocase protein TatC